MEQMTLDLMYLAACAVNEKAPSPEAIQRMDLKGLLPFAQSQTMAAMAAYALECSGAIAGMPEPDRSDWQTARNKAIRKVMLLNSERSRICGYMDETGIRYMQLKGCLLQEFYPAFGIREMMDNDILIDADAMGTMRKFMLSIGYKQKSFGGAIHDEYLKPPERCIELHSTLAGNEHPPKMIAYYQNVWEKLIPVEGKPCEYRFSDEDFYIYLIAHAYKHLRDAGIGLRVLPDLYVYLQKKAGTMNWDYIRAELEKMDIDWYENQLREMSLQWMSEPERIQNDPAFRNAPDLLEEMSRAGTFGTLENKVRNMLENEMDSHTGSGVSAKLHYYLDRLFPSMEWYRLKHPFLYRHKILIPFYSVYRIFWGLLFRRKKIQSEIEIVNRS